MKLSDFIRAEIEQILVHWDRFARDNAPPDSHLTDPVLRDHAKEMLLAVAADIETSQTPAQQKAKSEGHGGGDDVRSAASTHGHQRHRLDFSLVQLGAEFRALRSTVLRLWLPRVEVMSEGAMAEMVRFNEAIDQSIAESLVAFTDATTEARNLLLAVLGHDLRSPLATVALAGQMLVRDDIDGDQRVTLGQKVQRSASVMKSMVEDLLGYTRVQLGRGLPMRPAWCDIANVLTASISDAEATYPRTRYECHTEGDLAACYDPARLHQLFTNLLVNAAQHGTRSHPVVVVATSDADHVTVRITNQGRAIPEDALKSIFKPLVQLAPDAASDVQASTSLGLGLFIAREIAESHGGALDVDSRAEIGTTFTVRLPRDFSCKP